MIAQSQAMRIETITPERALAYLENNEANRPINKHHVLFLARIIAAGQWRLNGMSIKFDSNGQLRDGQHRLAAVIKAGIPIETWVISGLDVGGADVYQTIDTNSNRRRPAHFMVGIPSANELSALATLVIRYERGILSHYGGTAKIGTQDVVSRALDRELIDAHAQSRAISKDKALATRSQVAFLLWAFSRLQPHFAETFLSRVDAGVSQGAGDPVGTLRARLINAKIKRENLNSYEKIYFYFRAFKAFINGEQLGTLKILKRASKPGGKKVHYPPLPDLS